MSYSIPRKTPLKPSRNRIARVSKRKPTRVYAIKDGVLTQPDGREACMADKEGRKEYRARTLRMAERQGNRCAICGFGFDGWLGPPTFDHERGRTAGNLDERIDIDGQWHNAALHEKCNSIKGSKKYGWVDGNTRYVEVRKGQL